ncbi:unnamed protein product [Acanthoscelides obtectus]|uniref:Uncharacterized protein n=1 Tax=Acanthoscelides obtectus TaxID=200917 RepID=A0A9P0KKF5_ACAOB|nr:unnamed protein product [Acanthoscelides obtectus]CAK1657565.1 hypothetical protein AOBTE_LOCUS20421 [Acanthoscelides obtectus]
MERQKTCLTRKSRPPRRHARQQQNRLPSEQRRLSRLKTGMSQEKMRHHQRRGAEAGHQRVRERPRLRRKPKQLEEQANVEGQKRSRQRTSLLLKKMAIKAAKKKATTKFIIS